MSPLAGKRALVTGAGTGIGRATALRLSEMGCHLALLDLSVERLAETKAALQKSGGSAIEAIGSVADPAAVEQAFRVVDEAFGGLDILVNNAGITGNCPALDIDMAFWAKVIGVNQTGTLLCAQQAARRMISAGGCIVNLASTYGLVGAPNRLTYAATKAAVIMMTKVMAIEWAQLRIRVNCVAPGYVETPGTFELADAGKLDLDALRRRTPLGRLARPEDIANVIARLCTEDFQHVTGQTLPVDGGWTAYGYL